MNKGKNIDLTLKEISRQKESPKSLYILFILCYVVISAYVIRVAKSSGVFMIAGQAVPLSNFAGVLTSFANIFIVSLVIFFRKVGFFTALVMVIAQIPLWYMNIVVIHNYSAIPGMFTTVFALVTSFIIFINQLRVAKYQAGMQMQVVTDNLTKLPNRFACGELLNDLVQKKESFAVVSVDINNFKSINETMGHEAGNTVLTTVAKRWKDLADSWTTGTTDFVGRYGGDEYLIVIRGYEKEEDIIKSIKAYKSELEEKITIDDCDFFMTASIGYALFPEDADSKALVLSHADLAMHEMKLKQSDAIQRFTREMSNVEKIVEIERKLRSALENDHVMSYLQPQFDIEHKLRGYEALARIKDEDGSFIPPIDFIPVAEQTGLIDQVDLRVFEKAAEFFGRVIKQIDHEITLSINVSVRHLMKNSFVEEITGIMKKYEIPARQLEIEITESIMIDSYEKALERINAVKEMGIRIAIDDFGTGYSSLSYLNSFPADLLKVDKSFIDVMNDSDSSKQYVATIITIGHILNLEVISEGVETDEQLKTLESVGCDYIQGYFWGKPLPPEEAEKVALAS
ncbi:MAG: bifunctional diguanylate cyclase/phosphodiesterase [Lachnospiraceae bacterium]|nr:bifunctional diguanylate cyclase/phosphodiesterase [Lachnospiraceae bacterium]